MAWPPLVNLFAFLTLNILLFRYAFSYDRPPARPLLFNPLSDGLHSSSPQQVHISVSGNNKMRISWITGGNTPTTVRYGTSSGSYDSSANGTTSSYNYILYQSGQIHEVLIGPLLPSTTYYYKCGLDSSPELNFITSPAQFPIKFAVVGDVGQTEDSASTLQHIAKSNYDMWKMFFKESGSNSNLYYSFDVAGVHFIMLGSYTDFGVGSAQYQWLEGDLKQVDMSKTPWLVVIVHAPWYNSNKAHQGEAESVDMKAAMESLLYGARIDVVFAGHVHAYERFTRAYQEEADNCGPYYITIGDGGNREGLATKYKKKQPKISLFREASFGHGEFEIANTTHALWTWHRNEDDEAVESDSMWITSLSLDPSCKT